MILAGGSLYSVAKQWNAEGITTSQGNTWTGKTVRQNLLNSRNAALRSYQGEVLEGVTAAWPAIVTEDVWPRSSPSSPIPNANPAAPPASIC